MFEDIKHILRTLTMNMYNGKQSEHLLKSEGHSVSWTRQIKCKGLSEQLNNDWWPQNRAIKNFDNSNSIKINKPKQQYRLGTRVLKQG